MSATDASSSAFSDLPESIVPLPLHRDDGLVVLLVDDMPDNIAPLHDALDEAGYTVLVALDGASAIKRAQQALPDVVLLDAMMPGMDGFEVARRLKADERTRHVPIIFMTGLTETEHLVTALDAGGSDYVTKPVKPREVMARMGVHLRTARQAQAVEAEQSQTRNALDAFGYASITVRVSDGRLLWQTSLARELLVRYGGPDVPQAFVPEEVLAWLQRCERQAQEETVDLPRLVLRHGSGELSLTVHRQIGDEEDARDWLVVMQESSEQGATDALAETFGLTAREAEVLYWVVKGKTNRDIGDILGSSAGTVKKQLEKVFAKMGADTRTSAARMAMSRVGVLNQR
ncbi:response regulator transcription factor [Hydrogenophaga sp. 5NK40-0174]|uniref:response regulator transcription factor n=1 Tax=Hydrogenophaga sp. 5NK40-0174 TaxID=3127649 RepID=UPI003106FD4B